TAGPGVLDGMSAFRFLCLDDVDRVAGDEGWERALFVLYNEALSLDSVLVVSAGSSPRSCGFGLPDLESRFTQLPAFRLTDLDDEARKAALRLRARQRGLELPDATADYLLTRERRDMASLYAVLDRLDDEALAARRRLTVPFVKEVLRRS
ncbi:MAG: DnaA/Hda family protein, partial [Woeseiaceae bacterium]|nr:DnaA/Hda family protein [Woeseiaceae bacterium]